MENSKNLRSFAERVHFYRSVKRLKVKELAKLLGVTHQMVSYIEKGKQEKPSAKIIEAFVENTDINVGWLLTGRGEPVLGGIDQEVLVKKLEKLETENEELRKIVLEIAKERVGIEEPKKEKKISAMSR